VPVRIAAPFLLRSVRKDESTVPVVVKSTPVELIVRLEIDPADAAHQGDWFSLRSTDGNYQQHRSVKDDHTPGDQCVDLLFTGVDPALRYSLEVDPRPSGQAHLVFENRPYSELAAKAPDAPVPKDPGSGDFRVRLDVDPADLTEATDRFVLRGARGYQQIKTVKDDQLAGDQCVDLLFTEIPRTESLTLEIEDARGRHVVFSDVDYTDLAHLSGDNLEPEIRVHEMLDENPGAPAE
jgi:hypothetical protein